MRFRLCCPALAISLISLVSCERSEKNNPMFVHPERGFISTEPAENWHHGLLTGNGTTGALVRGEPFNETITLSHESLYLPYPKTEGYMEMASHLQDIRDLCLAGKYVEATEMVPMLREEQSYFDIRDPFIAAFNLRIDLPGDSVIRYQRSVDFMTAEARVSVEGQQSSFQRSTFVSRADDVVVVRLTGRKKLSATFTFEGITPENEREKLVVEKGIRSKQEGVQNGMLYFQTHFARTNLSNPNTGYEGVGKIITKGGSSQSSENGIYVADANEILLLIKIRPILKTEASPTNFEEIAAELHRLEPDYNRLLEPHAAIHGDLMSRASLSLDAPEENRRKPTEELIRLSEKKRKILWP